MKQNKPHNMWNCKLTFLYVCVHKCMFVCVHACTCVSGMDPWHTHAVMCVCVCVWIFLVFGRHLEVFVSPLMAKVIAREWRRRRRDTYLLSTATWNVMSASVLCCCRCPFVEYCWSVLWLSLCGLICPHESPQIYYCTHIVTAKWAGKL